MLLQVLFNVNLYYLAPEIIRKLQAVVAGNNFIQISNANLLSKQCWQSRNSLLRRLRRGVFFGKTSNSGLYDTACHQTNPSQVAQSFAVHILLI